MGRRRRRVIRIVKKKLPTVFVCPRCGEEAVRVTIAKDTGHATVLCALCNLKDEFPAHPAAQPIDVYSYFADRFYGVKEPRAIIPREREVLQAPSEEEPEEEMASSTPSTGEVSSQPTPLKSEIEEPASGSGIERTLSPEMDAPSQSARATEQAANVEASTTEEAPEVEEKESDEENEPFADILENKDKKRYSSQPLPQQSSEQTS